MLRTASTASITAALGVALAASPALAVFVDFNTAGDLAANFTIPAGTTTSQTFTEASDGGVGDSRAVRPKDSDATAVYNNGTFDIGVGETFVTSMFIHKVGFTANTSRVLQLGLGEDADNIFTTGDADFLSARVDTSSTNDRFELKVQHRANDGLHTLTQGSTFELTGEHLYLFTVEIERTGLDTFAIAGSLVDYGLDGQTPGATVASFAPVAVTNASVGGATPPALHAGFRSGYNAGAHRLDNYSAQVVPEPGSLGLALLGGTLVMMRRRRGPDHAA